MQLLLDLLSNLSLFLLVAGIESLSLLLSILLQALDTDVPLLLDVLVELPGLLLFVCCTCLLGLLHLLLALGCDVFLYL